MTEKEFGDKIEYAANKFEQMIEKSADKLDKQVTHKYETSKSFRRGTKLISAVAEIGLIFTSFYLRDRGHNKLAALCFWFGIAGIAVSIITACIFKRE